MSVFDDNYNTIFHRYIRYSLHQVTISLYKLRYDKETVMSTTRRLCFGVRLLVSMIFLFLLSHYEGSNEQ